jgi:dipeptidyl aminopeptidase/acylaminoacyl peptidase
MNFFLLALVVSAGPAMDDGLVTYKGRTINVKAYVEGFPYKSFFFDPTGGKVYFLRRGDTETLQSAPFSPSAPIDFTKATALSKIDFTKRNFWGLKVSPWNKKTYVKGDEDNAEIINLYELKADGSLKKLTNEGYIYDWALSPDGKKIAFIARSGNQEFTPGSVGVLDLKSGAIKKIFTDSKARRMTWTSVDWKPDGTAVLFGAVCDEDRTHKNLMLSKVDGSGTRELLDCKTKKSVAPTWEWLDDHNLLYVSDEPGNDVAYRLDPDSGAPTALTDPKWNLESADLLGDRLIALERKPISTMLHVIDPRSGKILSSTEYPASIGMMHGSRSVMLLGLSSPLIPWEVHVLSLEGDKPKLVKVLDYGEDLKKQMVHCKAEKVSFKTWDGLAAPGETGTLHAFLYTPLEPAKGADARLLVNSFYGGTNEYSSKIHMFCEAGFYVLSPAPRGSWDWGREFHDKMQGDLGGGEILDVVEGAKVFAKKLGIPASQVGAFGGSHGGFATLRALTLPEKVNGYAPGWTFGFGLSDYGISNLVRYVKNCNIPGWITDMTSEDPAKNPEKWLDRSPETHACKAHGPLFLSHGLNDKRVGAEESKAMLEALKKCGRTHDVLYLLPGQGHGFKGTAALVPYYRAVFAFLEGMQLGGTAADGGTR